MIDTMEKINRNNPYVIALDNLLKIYRIDVLSCTKHIMLAASLILIEMIIIISIIAIKIRTPLFIIPLSAPFVLLMMLIFNIRTFRKVISDINIKKAGDTIYGKKAETIYLNEELLLQYIKFINCDLGKIWLVGGSCKMISVLSLLLIISDIITIILV